MSDTTPPQTVPGNPSSPSILFLNRCVEQVFTGILDPNTELFQSNATLLGDSYAEFKVILQQVRQNNYQQLLPTLIAGLQFILGREAYENNDLEATLYHYRRSLEYWPSALAKGNLEMLSMANRETILPNQFIEQMGGVLFHLGLCFVTLGQSDNPAKNTQNLQEARNYFEKSLEIFEKVNRPDLMSKFIGELTTVLRELEEWDTLQKAAQKAIELHISYGSETQLAKDYGFLAEAALHESKWAHANQLAELALAIQGQSAYSDPMSTTASSNNSYLYLFTESKQELQQWETTVSQLEEALKRTSLEDDPKGYLRILTALHKLYFDQDLYIQASRLKEEKIKIEYQYGLRAFIGVRTLQAQSKPNEEQQSIAVEIENSGRLRDVQALFERIQDPEHKLIILHGESGVGKSSLLNAGIVPKLLKEHSRNSKVATPILLRIYTDWLREPNPKTWNLNSVVNLLKRNDQNQIPTVLIFDQFEEFFVVCKQLEQRLPFYEFLKESLSLDSITILLSLRDDALHYLLECDRLTNLEDVIHAEILSRKVLYSLENFTLNQAKILIQNQIERAQFTIEPNLMNQLIQDLTVNIDQIRPIELQLIGTQLQSNDIQTLEQYGKLGEYPRQKMLEQFLDEIIRDCSTKNERIVIKILNVLTSEQERRPLKTSKELAEELNTEFSKIEPLLAVLVEEGLILHLPDIPDDRYQLTHDYLVALIRQQKGERLIAQLELERDQAQRKIIEEKPNSFVNRAIALSYVGLTLINMNNKPQTEQEKMLAGELYLPNDPELVLGRKRASKLTRLYNSTTEDELETRQLILLELFDKIGNNLFITPPFYCDYGCHIKLGNNVYMNFNCVILDCNYVEIGDNVLLAPNVQIYAAYHPIDPELRLTGKELAAAIKIGDNVWIGGGAIVCPGVEIGENTTIGAGSVVVDNIPPRVLAAGNPCRVIRKL